MNMDESFDTMLDEEMARAQDLPTSGMEEFDFIRQFAGDHVPEHLMRNRVFISLLSYLHRLILIYVLTLQVVLDPDEAVALHRLLARGMDVQKYVEKYDELPYIGTHFLSYFNLLIDLFDNLLKILLMMRIHLM